MEREQIIKALECCTSEYSKCIDCPRYGFVSCTKTLLTDALSLIKELTAENVEVKANWQKLKESHENVCEECRAEFKRLTEENERLKAIPEQLHKEMSERMLEERKIERKLAVRKMQEKLYPLYKVLCVDEGDWRYEIDQIAKEMVEGG